MKNINLKDVSIEKTEDILNRIAPERWYRAWTQRVEGTEFDIYGYMVKGGLFIVQYHDNGSVYHFTQIPGLRWDTTEVRVKEYYDQCS